MLPIFEEANAIWVVLEGDNQTKLKYLTAAMVASKTSDKLIYETWLRLFDKGDSSRSSYVMEAFFLLALLVCVVEWPGGWLGPLHVPCSHSNHEGRTIYAGVAVQRFSISTTR